MDASQLSLEQLSSIRENLQQEVQHLTTSYEQLQQAKNKFSDCSASVKQINQQASEGKEILVPLTTSLYVPGKVANTDKFVVDVGTDYFVEKNTSESVKFFEGKIETLNKNLVDLTKIINEKASSLQAMEQLLTQRLTEARKAQAQAKAKAGPAAGDGPDGAKA